MSSFFKNLKATLRPLPAGERGQTRDSFEKRDIAFMDLAASTHPSPQPSPRRGEGATSRATQTKTGRRLMASSPLDHIISSVRGAQDDQAARLAFAFSAIAPNALMSCTAMSASTLRSTVMPALARPLIRRL
jgi:hypothetical protein